MLIFYLQGVPLGALRVLKNQLYVEFQYRFNHIPILDLVFKQGSPTPKTSSYEATP